MEIRTHFCTSMYAGVWSMSSLSDELSRSLFQMQQHILWKQGYKMIFSYRLRVWVFFKLWCYILECLHNSIYSIYWILWILTVLVTCRVWSQSESSIWWTGTRQTNGPVYKVIDVMHSLARQNDVNKSTGNPLIKSHDVSLTSLQSLGLITVCQQRFFS